MAVLLAALAAASAPSGAGAATGPAWAGTDPAPAWAGAASGLGPGLVAHHPPVAGAVAEPFRAPPHPYGPGHRGWGYALAPGTPVQATAGGEVLFAGAVAGALHVTVGHPDGLRTSYSYLASVAVVAGQVVAPGQVVGTSSHHLHLGVRLADGTYLDPAEVVGRAGGRPRLVPGAEEGAGDLHRGERGLLAALVAATWSAAAAVGEGWADRLALAAHYRAELDPATRLARVAAALDRRRRAGPCTPVGEPPPAPAGRRVAVLVGGLGSTSDAAAVDDVRTGELGYAPGDVVRFSYAGGRVPDPGDGPAFAAVPARPHGSAHSQGDLRSAGAELARLLAQVAAAAPGVPVDVVAHSQGGVVARLALARGPLPGVATVVTLGTPHQGADLATAAAALAPGRPEALVAGLAGFDPSGPAVAQLSEVSPVVADLADQAGRAAPGAGSGEGRGPRLVSVAASGDLVVPVPRTVVEGADHVVVPLAGLSAHDRLPGSAEATREIALAVGGRPPTCTSLGATLVGAVTGEVVSAAVDAYGAARLLDHGLP